MDRSGALARGHGRLRERADHARALDSLHLHRQCGAALVRVRMGDATARDRHARRLPLPAPRWPALLATTSTGRNHLAVSLAHLSDHDWRGPDQAAWRRLLARPHVPLLS